MTDLTKLTAQRLAAAIAAGDASATAAIDGCLARIAARDADVGAWEFLAAEPARVLARELDGGLVRGRLHGVPVGIKDIIETRDMPTGCGSPIYRGRQTHTDAACVAELRAAGAVVMGKTVTTEFAYFTPGKTRNPRALDHTPGGSSSGSAAAVADRMVPVALGTQTAGSIIRPAAFCGVIGYKPTYGSFSLAGVKSFSPSLDTLGLFARAVEDIALVRAVLLGADEPPPFLDAPRFAICRTPHWDSASAPQRQLVEQAASALANAGAAVIERDWPAGFAPLNDWQQTIMAFEAARAYAAERLFHGDKLSRKLMELIDRGLGCTLATYRAALAEAECARAGLPDLFEGVDALLTPPAIGEAPAGIAATGDPVFNRSWTLLHVPCITLPLGHGPACLPLGLQLIGNRQADARLLACAAWVTGRLGGKAPQE